MPDPEVRGLQKGIFVREPGQESGEAERESSWEGTAATNTGGGSRGGRGGCCGASRTCRGEHGASSLGVSSRGQKEGVVRLLRSQRRYQRRLCSLCFPAIPAAPGKCERERGAEPRSLGRLRRGLGSAHSPGTRPWEPCLQPAGENAGAGVSRRSLPPCHRLSPVPAGGETRQQLLWLPQKLAAGHPRGPHPARMLRASSRAAQPHCTGISPLYPSGVSQPCSQQPPAPPTSPEGALGPPCSQPSPSQTPGPLRTGCVCLSPPRRLLISFPGHK